MSSRLRVISVCVAVVAAAVVAAYSVYWFHVAGELRKGYERWVAERRAAGWTVEAASAEVGGFPGPVQLRLDRPAVATPEGLRWQAEHVTGRMSPFDLTRVRVLLNGRHQLTTGAATTFVDAGSADLLVHLHRDGRLDDATLTGTAVSLSLTGLAEPLRIANLAATLDPVEAAAPGHDSRTAAVLAAAQGITLPAIPGLVMERRIAMVDLRAHVLGKVPAAPPLDALTRWSADGGTVEVEHLLLEWAPLSLEAEGTLALDPGLQPLAAMSARVRGYGEFMDRLAKAGLVAPGPAGAAKLLLGMMAKPDKRGRPSLPVPLTVQDGGLWFGPARVMALPPVQWSPQ